MLLQKREPLLKRMGSISQRKSSKDQIKKKEQEVQLESKAKTLGQGHLQRFRNIKNQNLGGLPNLLLV